MAVNANVIYEPNNLIKKLGAAAFVPAFPAGAAAATFFDAFNLAAFIALLII